VKRPFTSYLFTGFPEVYDLLYRLSHWETWPWIAKYIPIIPAWLWLCLKARSFWFFTSSNPTLTFGGYEGESKKEMYAQLPEHSYPRTTYIKPQVDFTDVVRIFVENNFEFPVAVKPDIGMMGYLFRKINSWEELRSYHERMPVEYILQEFVQYPLEVSVFYYRFPNQKKGTITGFVRKDYLQVTGNGKSTLLDLILNYPRVRYRIPEMKAKHAPRLHDVIPAGEIYCLSEALNLSRGGQLVSLEHEKDEKLLRVFDELSHYAKHFYYGRYDIKCKSIEDLKQGKNYYILEFNGSGAEPHHVYGSNNSLFRALYILCQHWNILYKISKYNKENGVEYWNFKRGIQQLAFSRRHFRKLANLDLDSPAMSVAS
jgi:hypothetical protein